MRCKNCGQRQIEIKRINKVSAIALCKVCLFAWIINLFKGGAL